MTSELVLPRRSLLLGLASSLLAAPAIVRATSIMPVRAPPVRAPPVTVPSWVSQVEFHREWWPLTLLPGDSLHIMPGDLPVQCYPTNTRVVFAGPEDLRAWVAAQEAKR